MSAPRSALFPCLAVAAGVFGIALISGLGWWANAAFPARKQAAPSSMRTTAARPVSARFSLMDGDGRIVTQNSFQGRWTVIYFGYSFCPDVCPTELSKLTQALDLLGPALDPEVQPVFITVDPERDTQQHIKDYAALFHPRLVGLTGTPELVADAIRSFNVYAAKREVAGMSDYLMDHSSYFYLLGPDGRFSAQLSGNTSPEELAAVLRERLTNPAAASRPPTFSEAGEICTWDNTPVPQQPPT